MSMPLKESHGGDTQKAGAHGTWGETGTEVRGVKGVRRWRGKERTFFEVSVACDLYLL